MRRMLFATLAGALLLAPAPSLRAAAPVRVMILDGQSAGTYHDWQHTTPVLKKELDETGLFRVDVVTAPPGNGDFSQFHPDFAVQPILDTWAARTDDPFPNYDAGTWGPKASDEMLARRGHTWRVP